MAHLDAVEDLAYGIEEGKEDEALHPLDEAVCGRIRRLWGLASSPLRSHVERGGCMST